MPKITCGIPTIGRTETLAATLNSIAFQTFQIDELILLDESEKPVTESYAVSQALDYLSLLGVRVVVLRERRRLGIGPARFRLCSEARNWGLLQVDDDVVLHPRCLEELIPHVNFDCPWAVPTCLLVNPELATGMHLDEKVDRQDPRVLEWTTKYPWFIPYFRYRSSFCCDLAMAGTQAILLDAGAVIDRCRGLLTLGKLPREDSYLTSQLGTGKFVSDALCVHYEHASQVDRGNWKSSMFYRLHQAIQASPRTFINFIGGRDV